ncbi:MULTISPECIES: hypothetical protein [Trichocoleus]|uniref:Uncharacterized protein n=1 Tax=Trichocoleus desertorum GB2-A4 TaxID=2933944 RepID=A0ABV0JG79_9CYAN|nr:hypothetical protein [Trichocoleus sp. FACHB-46]MBD1865276.1 hypothetical protein [Trichocoleus sp. FACHB-46]
MDDRHWCKIQICKIEAGKRLQVVSQSNWFASCNLELVRATLPVPMPQDYFARVRRKWGDRPDC